MWKNFSSVKNFLVLFLIFLCGQVAIATDWQLSNNPFNRMTTPVCDNNGNCTSILKRRKGDKYTRYVNIVVQYNEKKKTVLFSQNFSEIAYEPSQLKFGRLEVNINNKNLNLWCFPEKNSISSNASGYIEGGYVDLSMNYMFTASGNISKQHIEAIENELKSCEVAEKKSFFNTKKYKLFCSTPVVFSFGTIGNYEQTQLKDLVYLKNIFVAEKYKFLF